MSQMLWTVDASDHMVVVAEVLDAGVHVLLLEMPSATPSRRLNSFRLLPLLVLNLVPALYMCFKSRT